MAANLLLRFAFLILASPLRVALSAMAANITSSPSSSSTITLSRRPSDSPDCPINCSCSLGLKEEYVWSSQRVKTVTATLLILSNPNDDSIVTTTIKPDIGPTWPGADLTASDGRRIGIVSGTTLTYPTQLTLFPSIFEFRGTAPRTINVKGLSSSTCLTATTLSDFEYESVHDPILDAASVDSSDIKGNNYALVSRSFDFPTGAVVGCESPSAQVINLENFVSALTTTTVATLTQTSVLPLTTMPAMPTPDIVVPVNQPPTSTTDTTTSQTSTTTTRSPTLTTTSTSSTVAITTIQESPSTKTSPTTTALLLPPADTFGSVWIISTISSSNFTIFPVYDSLTITTSTIIKEPTYLLPSPSSATRSTLITTSPESIITTTSCIGAAIVYGLGAEATSDSFAVSTQNGPETTSTRTIPCYSSRPTTTRVLRSSSSILLSSTNVTTTASMTSSSSSLNSTSPLTTSSTSLPLTPVTTSGSLAPSLAPSPTSNGSHGLSVRTEVLAIIAAVMALTTLALL